MKRSYLERFFLLFAIFFIFFISFSVLLYPIYGENNSPRTKVFQWLNEIRKSKSLPLLSKDPILEKVALKYAKQLGKNGYISHIDNHGNRAIKRYRDAGGTATRIGEIIGAGKDLVSIEKKWIESNEHNRVITDPLWNSVGIGFDKDYNVYVVLFTTLFTREVKIKTIDRNYFLITGYFDSFKKSFMKITSKTLTPILLTGLKKYTPEVWNPETGYFSFKLRQKDYSFCRIAFIKNGNLIITDILPENPTLLMNNVKNTP